MDELRRVGGSVEPYRAFKTPRFLLPAEIQLIKAIGLTEEEYWDFVRINNEYNGKRSEAYAHIPDIKNDPITPIIVNLVIGLALTAVSALLAPKPKSPEERKDPNPLQTDDQTSRSRYAPQTSFDSLQQLASLGSVIPLVYCDYRADAGLGGVRVNSKLLWSYMTTLGRSQQLRALMLFSHGEVASKPDFDGYAIGDLLLSTYALGKCKLFFNTNGLRFTQAAAYPRGEMQDLSGGQSRDAFAVEWGEDIVPFFSGARTPRTQAVFGTHAPLPNGNAYRVNYELVLNISSSSNSQVKIDNDTKRAKANTSFPRYGYVFGPPQNSKAFTKGQEVTYILDRDEYPSNAFEPWGTDDVRTATNNGRFEADSNIVVGETYLIGTGFGVCIRKRDSPWRPNGESVAADFKLTTDAIIDVTGPTYTLAPDGLLIQRVAVATITNNRACDRTDLLIKSIVYRKINGFPNVNSEPSDETIREYERNDSPITLGNLNVYNKRLSFFALQYRNIGESEWKTMTNDTGFCVLGRTPEAVYNMISIIHPQTKQFEFQLVPIAGNAVKRYWFGKEMYMLQAASEFDEATGLPKISYINYASPDGAFTITYTGSKQVFDGNTASNGEWVVKGYSGPNIPTSYNLRYTDACQDFILYDSEELSNAGGPEHEIVAVNELLADYNNPLRPNGVQYTDLAYAGIRLNSGAEWSSFSELSAYFKQGILVQKLLSPSQKGATNLLPEIAYDLLTNTSYGVGELVGESQVDIDEMRSAALFCQACGFFWDGVIGERVNIREWIYEMAGYNLLQFRIKGGRFSLFPDVPWTNSGIDFDAPIPIKQIFTDGNMKDLQVSFLQPEERQLFKCVVLWRQDEVNGFPQTRTLVVSLTTDENGNSRNPDKDPEETFDMAGFCTSENHALTFAKYALKIRQLVDHGLKFQTTPEIAMGLEPGQYFTVASAVSHPTARGSAGRLNNGSIAADGTVVGLPLEDGMHLIQYWRPGTEGLREENVQVLEGKVLDMEVRNTIFALSLRNNPTTRAYKVESLTYAEDGLVEVAGSFAPLTATGSLATLDWGSADFKVETA